MVNYLLVNTVFLQLKNDCYGFRKIVSEKTRMPRTAYLNLSIASSISLLQKRTIIRLGFLAVLQLVIVFGVINNSTTLCSEGFSIH